MGIFAKHDMKVVDDGGGGGGGGPGAVNTLMTTKSVAQLASSFRPGTVCQQSAQSPVPPTAVDRL